MLYIPKEVNPLFRERLADGFSIKLNRITFNARRYFLPIAWPMNLATPFHPQHGCASVVGRSETVTREKCILFN
jgi:hypothetical protein